MYEECTLLGNRINMSMNREADQFIGGTFTWFTGVVEDIVDTDNLGRVKVRCFGYHTDDKNIIKTEDLPWATVMGPTTSAGVQGIGSNHRLLSGSWVVGFFRDGPSAQDPLIIGSIASQTEELPDKSLGFSGDYPARTGLDLPFQAWNKAHDTHIHVTPSGHVIELDDTTDQEVVQVTHMSGTLIRLHPDGTIELNSSNNTVNIVGNTTVTGTIRASDEITAKFSGDESVTLTGHTHAQTGGTSGDSDADVDTASPTAET